jgi:hypothetical protein
MSSRPCAGPGCAPALSPRYRCVTSSSITFRDHGLTRAGAGARPSTQLGGWLCGLKNGSGAHWIARQLTEAYGDATIYRSRPGIASMEMSSSSGSEQWVYGIGRSRHGRHGKTDVRRGSSVRSDGIVLTMLLCSASGISVICSILTKNITTRLVRTYRCTRTRRSRVPSRLSVARWRCQFWADCTTNISERKFPTGTPISSLAFPLR